MWENIDIRLKIIETVSYPRLKKNIYQYLSIFKHIYMPDIKEKVWARDEVM